jgi:pimeloyl-ACP methyl ester carboxylesterase
MEHPTFYRTAQIDESSRMFEPLFVRLSDRYHLVAPDYPGFGHSDWPGPKEFAYTFDRRCRGQGRSPSPASRLGDDVNKASV